MDFRCLARRDLQFLCKKNRIPANQTNVAMANALQALKTVEGIYEIQEALGFQSPKKPESKSPELPSTNQRASARFSNHGDKPSIQEQRTSSLPRSRRVTVKAVEVIEMDSKEEEGEKKEAMKLLPKTPATTRRTSRGQEASSSIRKANQRHEASIFTPTTVHTGRTRLAKRVAAETPKVVEAKEGKTIGVINRRSTRLSSRKAEETTTAKAESGSSSSKAKEAVKMSALAKEDAEEQETEEEKKASAENGDSSVLLVEDVGKKDQEVKSQGISSTLGVESSKVEVIESPEEIRENNQEIESHGLPSFLEPEKEEAAGNELVKAAPLQKLSIMTSLPGGIGTPEVKESSISNEAFAFVKDSSEQTPTDEVLKYSSSSEANVTISSDTEVLLSCGAEKEGEEKLALLFTEMTLKEAAESGDALSEAGIVQDASFISINSTSETDFVEEAPVTNGDSSTTETSNTEFPKEAESTNSPPAVSPKDAPLDFKNLDAVSDLWDEEPLVTKAIGVSFSFASESPNKVKEIAGDQTSELKVSVEMPYGTENLQEEIKETSSNLTDEILEVSVQEAGELAAKELVDTLAESAEEGKENSDEFSSKLSTVIGEIFESIEMLQKDSSISYELQISVPSTEDSSAVVITETFVEAEEGADDSTNELKGIERDMCSTKTMPLYEFSMADLAAVVMTEEKEETNAIENEEGADDDCNELNGSERDISSTEIMSRSEFSKVVQIQSTDSEVADLVAGEMTKEEEETKAVETEEGADNDSNELSDFSQIVQFQSTDSEVADLAAFEMTEEKEETKAVETEEGEDPSSSNELSAELTIVVQIQSTDSEVEDLAAVEMTEEKAVETQKSIEDQNITAELSLTKLKVMMPKQKLGDSENETDRKDKPVKDDRLVDLSLTKLRAMYKQKLDYRKNEMERSKSVNSSTQKLNDDLQCLSHNKLYAVCTQKLNDDRNKLGKRTPLKNLN